MADYEFVNVTLVADTNAYADNDVLAIPQLVGKVHGTLESILLHDQADQAVDIDLVFMNANGTLGTINAAVTMSDADAQKIIGKVSLVAADYIDLVNSQIATKADIGLPLVSQTLYVGAIVRSGTPTYAASSLRLQLGFVRY